MVDINSPANPLFLREEELHEAIELLFFAYRDFTGEPDRILAAYRFGRAHHRVIYFVGRNPGLSVSDLLTILNITKQSLSRVLRQLVDEGFIQQETGTEDRRRRHLELSEKGRALESLLSETQRQFIANSYAKAGPEAVSGFKQILLGLLGDKDQNRFLK
jgi:DNA-binding MarR family transcriptional regulator